MGEMFVAENGWVCQAGDTMGVEVAQAADPLTYTNAMDRAIFDAYERIVRRGDFCLDVGCNMGVHTVKLAALGARVLAIEPQRRVALQCQANALLHEMEGRVEVLCVALWDVPGQRLAPRVDLTLPSAGYRRFDPAGAEQTDWVDAVAGDDLLTEARRVHGSLARVRLIKVDAQGADYRILRGFQHTITTDRPYLIWEHETYAHEYGEAFPREVPDWLTTLGYTFEKLTDVDTLATPPPAESAA